MDLHVFSCLSGVRLWNKRQSSRSSFSRIDWARFPSSLPSKICELTFMWVVGEFICFEKMQNFNTRTVSAKQRMFAQELRHRYWPFRANIAVSSVMRANQFRAFPIFRFGEILQKCAIDSLNQSGAVSLVLAVVLFVFDGGKSSRQLCTFGVQSDASSLLVGRKRPTVTLLIWCGEELSPRPNVLYSRLCCIHGVPLRVLHMFRLLDTFTVISIITENLHARSKQTNVRRNNN